VLSRMNVFSLFPILIFFFDCPPFCLLNSIGFVIQGWLVQSSGRAKFLHDIWSRTFSLMVICFSLQILKSCGISLLQRNCELLVSYPGKLGLGGLMAELWTYDCVKIGLKHQINKWNDFIFSEGKIIKLWYFVINYRVKRKSLLHCQDYIIVTQLM
jgi:hypothetical protein